MPKRQSVFVCHLDDQIWNLLGCEDKNLRALLDGESPEQAEQLLDLRVQEVIVPLLDQLPAKEADMVEMHYLQHKKQQDIAYIFGITQAAVSYRIGRAMQRLKFLIEAPKMTDQEIQALLEQFGLRKKDIKLLLLYRHLSNQSAVARTVGANQSIVRHRIVLCTKRLGERAKLEPQYREVARLFEMLGEHHNIMNEVQLPQWTRRVLKTRDDAFGV